MHTRERGSILVSGMHSDLVLDVARWTAISVVTLIFVLLVYILFLRGLLQLRQERHHRFVRKWRPILLDIKDEPPRRLPHIHVADRLSFMILWNQMGDEIGDAASAREWLNAVAARAGMDRVAVRWLTKRSLRKRLLATVMLGQMRDRRSWQTLDRMAVADHSLLSLVAVQALVRIDPQAATPIIVPLIARRPDWPSAKVASILSEIGPDSVSGLLADAILKVPPDELPRLLPYLEMCRPDIALPVVRQLVRKPSDDKVIGPCLNVIGKFRDKDDLDMVRHFLTHARWHVRAHAATCLGKIGAKEDEERLVTLLADPQWWVRYRAAQALLDLPSVGYERVRRLKDVLKDEYAKDILEQVVAEKRLA